MVQISIPKATNTCERKQVMLGKGQNITGFMHYAFSNDWAWL